MTEIVGTAPIAAMREPTDPLQPHHKAFTVAFSAVALLFVTAFVLLVPVGFGLDEEHHTFRAWQVSRGVLTPETITPGKQYGGDIPEPLVTYVIAGTDAANAARGTGAFWSRNDISLAQGLGALGAAHLSPETPTRLEEFTNAGASTFVPYIPAAIGMRIGTAVGLDIAGIVTLAKLCNAVAYVVLTSIAILSLRRSRWRWLAAVIALLPLSIFQASVLTADTVSNAFAVAFVSLTLAVMRSTTRIRPVWLALLAVSALGLIAAKPTYALMLPVILALPPASLGMVRRSAWAVKVGALVFFALVATLVTRASRTIAGAIKYQVPDADGIDQSTQLSHLLAEPLEGLRVLIRTVVTFGSSWVEGSLTMFGTNSVFAPQPISVGLIAILIVSALRGDRIRAWRGWVLVAFAAITCAAVIGALYLTFTPIGAPYANGVQGRYWIPLLLPFLAGLGIVLPIRVDMSERAAAVVIGSVSISALVISLVVWTATVW